MQSKLLYQKQLSKFLFTTYSDAPDFKFHELNQVHGIRCVAPNKKEDADGYIFNEIEIPLCIRTADCLPIVIEGDNTSAFIHAGWRGLYGGILSQEKMALIVNPKIFIGPHIGPCCYEVGEEFKNYFREELIQRNQKIYLDMVSVVKNQMPHIEINTSGICTHCQFEFHSYRKDKTERRNHNILRLVN